MKERVLEESRQYSAIAELLEDEVSAVSGGVLPFLAAVASVAMNSTAQSLGIALISRGLSIYGVYSAATYYGGSGSGGGARKDRRQSSLTSEH